MSEQEEKSFELDGTRPIESTEMEVVDTYEEDGTRPIAKGRDFLIRQAKGEAASSQKNADIQNKNKKANPTDVEGVVDTYEEDGTRPIKSGEMNVADTYEEDGTRPIAESPDFLMTNSQRETAKASQDNSSSDTNKPAKADKNPVGSSSREVVDTFEADGTRPVMSNKYDVVDTLGVDGNRPITSESNIKPKKS